jgi:hypothetical protein
MENCPYVLLPSNPAPRLRQIRNPSTSLFHPISLLPMPLMKAPPWLSNILVLTVQRFARQHVV